MKNVKAYVSKGNNSFLIKTLLKQRYYNKKLEINLK